MENLIEKLKRKDRVGFEYFYKQYSGALYGVILRMVKDEETARDLLQDTLVKIWANIDRYDETKGRLFTWALNVTRNTALDYLRVKKRSAIESARVDPNLFKTYEHYTNLAVSPARSFNHIGVQLLPDLIDPRNAEVIELFYFRGLFHAEVAERLGLPVGTVKSRILAGLRQLRVALANDLAVFS